MSNLPYAFDYVSDVAYKKHQSSLLQNAIYRIGDMNWKACGWAAYGVRSAENLERYVIDGHAHVKWSLETMLREAREKNTTRVSYNRKQFLERLKAIRLERAQKLLYTRDTRKIYTPVRLMNDGSIVCDYEPTDETGENVSNYTHPLPGELVFVDSLHLMAFARTTKARSFEMFVDHRDARLLFVASDMEALIMPLGLSPKARAKQQKLQRE